MNDSERMPRFWVYHSIDLGMEETVRTRWSRDLMVAATARRADVDAILMSKVTDFNLMMKVRASLRRWWCTLRA